jgi:hypothetical protein
MARTPVQIRRGRKPPRGALRDGVGMLALQGDGAESDGSLTNGLAEPLTNGLSVQLMQGGSGE